MSFIDASGVRALLRSLEHAEEIAVSLRLLPGGGQARRLLALVACWSASTVSEPPSGRLLLLVNPVLDSVAVSLLAG